MVYILAAAYCAKYCAVVSRVAAQGRRACICPEHAFVDALLAAKVWLVISFAVSIAGLLLFEMECFGRCRICALYWHTLVAMIPVTIACSIAEWSLFIPVPVSRLYQ